MDEFMTRKSFGTTVSEFRYLGMTFEVLKCGSLMSLKEKHVLEFFAINQFQNC
jgi:hypothetical protein